MNTSDLISQLLRHPSYAAFCSLLQGDQFNLLGDLASLLIPILAVAAVGVGIFASQTYNE